MGLFQIKPDIHYGANSLDILRTMEIEKVFLVTDENMVKLKVVNRITNILKYIRMLNQIPQMKKL